MICYGNDNCPACKCPVSYANLILDKQHKCECGIWIAVVLEGRNGVRTIVWVQTHVTDTV